MQDALQCILIIVLKTGPDRPVEPVEPETGRVTGPIWLSDRPCK